MGLCSLAVILTIGGISSAAAAPTSGAITKGKRKSSRALRVIRYKTHSCHVFPGYVALVTSVDMVVGETIRLKRAKRAKGAVARLCKKLQGPYVFSLKGDADYLRGMYRHRLVVENGTGTPHRVNVYNVRTGKLLHYSHNYGVLRYVRFDVIALTQPVKNPKIVQKKSESCAAYQRRAFRAVVRANGRRFKRASMPRCGKSRIKGYCDNVTFYGLTRLSLKTLRVTRTSTLLCFP